MHFISYYDMQVLNPYIRSDYDTIARLCEAETGVLGAWSTDEIESYISLLEKYVSDLKLQIERMYDN